MGKEFKPISFDMKVKSITKTEREKEDRATTQHKLMARDEDGVNEATIVSARPFVGISAGTIIQVVIQNSAKDPAKFAMPKKEKEED